MANRKKLQWHSEALVTTNKRKVSNNPGGFSGYQKFVNGRHPFRVPMEVHHILRAKPSFVEK
ncbi:hypothetical protein LguiA_028061 [Lonicera macranthoides]